MTQDLLSDDDNKHIDEASATASQPKPVGSEIIKQQPYTDEEAFEILESNGTLDSKRLTPSQKLIQRSFDSHYTKKLQETAETRRQYEAKMSEPKNIFEAFERDPSGVRRQLNEAIFQKASEDPFSEETLKLQKLKGDLEIFEIESRKNSQMADNIVKENDSFVRNAIPDFNDKKAQELTNFAIQEMGLTVNDIAYLTNHQHGGLAGKITVGINKLYQKFNAGKTAETKAVKPIAPPSLGRAGTSVEVNPNKGSDIKKAMNSGKIEDWGAYIEQKTRKA